MRLAMLLVVAAIAATAAWEWSSPERSVEKLREAAQAGDTSALSEVVDFDSVRTHLKSDAHDRLADAVGRDPGLLGSLGMAMGDVMVDRAIESLVTPRSVAAVTRDGSLDAEPDIDRTGVNTFVAHFEDQAHDVPPLEFRRDGFRWKLVRIRLAASDPGWKGR